MSSGSMQLPTRDGEGWFRRTSVRAQSPFARGDHALFSLHKRKKFQKRSVQPCRLTAPPHRLPSKKIPTSPHARIVGSNGVPQRDHGFPHSRIFPHRVRSAESKFHLTPRAPYGHRRGLRVGSFARKIHPRTNSRPRSKSIPRHRSEATPLPSPEGEGGSQRETDEVLLQNLHRVPVRAISLSPRGNGFYQLFFV